MSDDPHLTDLGNAQRIVERHGHDMRFCHPSKTWFCWDGRRWAEDTTGQAMRFAKETAVSLGRWAAERIAALPDGDAARVEKARLMRILQHASKWEDARRLSASLELARSEPSIPILPEQLDRDPWLLNLENGTLDLRTGQLFPHRREDLITKLAPVKFDPAAACPIWTKFLDRIMNGNQNVIGYLQRVVGYALTADVREQVLWFFYGSGANGKSTFLVTLRELLGDYGLQAVSELLMAKNNESHPTERADLMGKRFVATIETERGKHLAESLTKQLSGGDKLRARRMRQDFVEFSPTWKLFLAANHKPIVRGSDLAIWRRIKMVPFTVTIPDPEKDRDLPAKLRAEASGILNWALAGCLDWQRTGLKEPNEVKEATAQYAAEQNQFEEFISECCEQYPTARVPASLLFQNYRKCTGDDDTSFREFGQWIRDHGFDKKRGHGGAYVYLGLRLKDVVEEGSGEQW